MCDKKLIVDAWISLCKTATIDECVSEWAMVKKQPARKQKKNEKTREIFVFPSVDISTAVASQSPLLWHSFGDRFLAKFNLMLRSMAFNDIFRLRTGRWGVFLRATRAIQWANLRVKEWFDRFDDTFVHKLLFKMQSIILLAIRRVNSFRCGKMSTDLMIELGIDGIDLGNCAGVFFSLRLDWWNADLVDWIVGKLKCESEKILIGFFGEQLDWG